MRVVTKLALAPVLFGLLLVPVAALAGTTDCPVEPAANTPLADGEVLAGTNCTLNTAGDVDSFVFSATAGATFQLAVGISGAAYGVPNICLTLLDPNGNKVTGGCTNTLGNAYSVVIPQALTVTGKYTVDIKEPFSGAVNYAVSLERLYPFPPNAQHVTLGTLVAGDIAPLTDSNAFTFGVAAAGTNGIYQVAATIPANYGQNNVCMTVYSPTGANAGSGCTNSLGNVYTIPVVLTHPAAGTYMAFVTQDGNYLTATYNLEVSCVQGTCKQTPSCTLDDALSYASGTLTMNFTIENTYATTWNIWLTDQNTVQLLYSQPQAIENSPTVVTKTATLSPQGIVGVLSTLTTPAKGITCSSWAVFETGAP